MTTTEAAVLLGIALILFIIATIAFIVWLAWPWLDDDINDVEGDDDE